MGDLLHRLKTHLMNNLKISCGGIIFGVTQELVTKYSESMLGKMFSSSSGMLSSKQDEQNAFLLEDRNTIFFVIILEYLMTNTIPPIKDKEFLETFVDEVKYYGLNDLCMELESR